MMKRWEVKTRSSTWAFTGPQPLLELYEAVFFRGYENPPLDELDEHCIDWADRQWYICEQSPNHCGDDPIISVGKTHVYVIFDECVSKFERPEGLEDTKVVEQFAIFGGEGEDYLIEED